MALLDGFASDGKSLSSNSLSGIYSIASPRLAMFTRASANMPFRSTLIAQFSFPSSTLHRVLKWSIGLASALYSVASGVLIAYTKLHKKLEKTEIFG